MDIVVTISGEENDVADVDCTFAATNSATQKAIAIKHVNQIGTVSGFGNSWTRRFRWDTWADLGVTKINDLKLVVSVDYVNGVQLWENGPYWAIRNLGAQKAEENGLFFAW